MSMWNARQSWHYVHQKPETVPLGPPWNPLARHHIWCIFPLCLERHTQVLATGWILATLLVLKQRESRNWAPMALGLALCLSACAKAHALKRMTLPSQRVALTSWPHITTSCMHHEWMDQSGFTWLHLTSKTHSVIGCLLQRDDKTESRQSRPHW